MVVDAEQFFEKDFRDSEFLIQAVQDKANISETWATKTAADGRYFIQTLEGEITVSDGDYVICGVQGEFYPCKPDIFSQIYNPLI